MAVKVTYGGRFPDDLISKARIERANYDLANQVMSDMDRLPRTKMVHYHNQRILPLMAKRLPTPLYAKAQFYGFVMVTGSVITHTDGAPKASALGLAGQVVVSTSGKADCRLNLRGGPGS